MTQLQTHIVFVDIDPEDEAAFEAPTHTAVEIPVDLLPAVRELLAKHRRSA